MNEDDAITLLSQHVARLHARADALQTVLLATVSALGRASPSGARQIEEMALKASEAWCLAQQAKGGVPQRQIDDYRAQVEEILLATRAAVTGKGV